MRKILVTYLPASLLLAFLAMVLLTCGGGGGDSGSASTATLTGLSISGPSSMPEYGTATYTATASWDDNTTSTVTPNWSVDSHMATIGTDGCLSCQGGFPSDQTVTITATYTSGEITKTATMDMTITHVSAPHIPFTKEELSGKAFFTMGGFNNLYKLNTDSSLEIYLHVLGSPGDRGWYITGTWSNDPDSLFLDFRFADMGPYTVYRIADSSMDMEVEIHEVYFQTDHAWVVSWEKTVPVTPAALPGTYSGSDGNTWVFNADGTGSIPDFPGGGLTFTWSVDSEGVLRMPFNTGYTGSLYARATSTAWGIYAVLKGGFTEHNTSSGAFYAYYGGIELTRQ